MFDLDSFVLGLRLRRWRVARVGKRASQLFAANTVLNTATFAGIRKETLRVRRLWAALMQDLALRRLWFFYPNEAVSPADADFDVSRFALTYRRCRYCRPSFLFFYPTRKKASEGRINYQIRPCHRSLCPFCFARRSQWQFRYVKQQLNKWLREGRTDIVLTYRSRKEFVPAKGFSPDSGCSLEDVLAMAKRLRAVIQQHRRAYKKLRCSKLLHRRTVGALWRVVVTPAPNGWYVETRQLVAAPNSLRQVPFAQLKFRTTGTYARLPVFRDAQQPRKFNDQFFEFFSEFCRYPKELLTCHTELTAAVLWATHKLPMLAATGAFRGAALRSAACFRRLSENSFAVKNAARTTDAAQPS